MGQVTVGINGRSYTVGCDTGQEEHVAELAAYLDHHIAELKEQIGSVGDTRLILLAGLMVADELSEAVAKLEALGEDVNQIKKSQDAVVDQSNGFEAETAETINAIAARIEDLTERLSAG
jgi:cell division protein ZapA